MFGVWDPFALRDKVEALAGHTVSKSTVQKSGTPRPVLRSETTRFSKMSLVDPFTQMNDEIDAKVRTRQYLGGVTRRVSPKPCMCTERESRAKV